MKDYIKRQGAAFYFDACSILLSLAAIIAYLIGAIGRYYNDANFLIVLLLALAIILLVATIFLRSKLGKFPMLRFVNVGGVILLMFALTLLAGARVSSIGFILVSNLGSDNAQAMSCLIASLVSMGAMLVCVITIIIGSFLSYEKKERS